MAWAAQRLPSPPMRICIVTWEYPPLVVGGIAPHVYGIATALAADGHEVVVLTRHHPDATEDSRHNGVRVLRAHVDLPWVPGENLVAQVCSANHKITQLAARLPQRWRPDVVHAHDWLVAWTADSLAALWKRPLVATIHATERGRHQGSITNTMSETINATEWWLSYQARRVITCSAFMRDEVLGAFSLPLDKLDVIANGVDPAVWAPGPGAVRTTDHPLIVTWGRLQYEKGFQHVIEAAVQLRGRFPTLEVVIAGRGSYAEDLARLAVSLGVSDIVRFTGFTADGELRALLHRCGAAVIPSLYEPFGIVALEAMAAGAPLVASTTGGLGEILTGTDAAELYEPGDVAGLSAALATMLSPGGPAEKRRRRASALVQERFSWARIATRTQQVYEAAIAGT
jgi:glycogen synthase